MVVVRLPWRFAPLESHKLEAMARARAAMAAHPGVDRWVLAGHSLGAALAARMAGDGRAGFDALVLVATTHPKEHDRSGLAMPVTKVYGTHDGVAPMAKVKANRELLPDHTRWVEIAGANHSQFGRYGRQLLDGEAAIGREAQEAQTRAALLEVLAAL